MTQKPRFAGFGSQCPPDENHVRVYFLQQGATLDQAVGFYKHYNVRQWINNYSKPLKNWKRLAWTWIWHGRSMRDYTGKSGSFP